MPNDKSASGFLKYLYDQFVQGPSDKMRENIGTISNRMGNTTPQTFPQDIGASAMAALGILGSPFDVTRPVTQALGQATHPMVGEAADMAVGLPMGASLRNMASVGAREASSLPRQMGQFARREAFGHGTERVTRDIGSEVMALRNRASQELGVPAHSTNVSEAVGKQINLDQANHLMAEREKFSREFQGMMNEAAKTGKFPQNAGKLANERGQVPEEIVNEFIMQKFGRPGGRGKYSADEVKARLDWLNGGGDPKHFPSN